jgi:hypothetical protein
MGQISDAYIAGGTDAGEALRSAMTWGLAAFAVSTVFLTLALRYLPADEASRLSRARALGEEVVEGG